MGSSEFSWRAVLIFLALGLLLLLSLSSAVWAMPGQHALRQTVPSRTPTKPGAALTPVSKATEVALRPIPSATPNPRPTGANPTTNLARQVLLIVAGVLVVAGVTVYILMRRRGTTSGR